MSTVKVLCVDNHVEYLDPLKYMLETAGYEVVSATTGSQGLSMLMKHPIQGVLLEYNLPDATGAAVRAEMKRRNLTFRFSCLQGLEARRHFCSGFSILISATRNDRSGLFKTWMPERRGYETDSRTRPESEN